MGTKRIIRLQFFLLLYFGTSLWAIDPGRHITQYAHTAWKTGDGVYVGSPTTITQAADGYLWIGTTLGLVRFDGVRFVQWKPPAGQQLPDPRVFSLLGTSDGSLWIGTGYSLSRWKDQQLTNFPGLSGRIEALLEGDAGSIWLARTQITDSMGPLCRIKEAQVRCFGSGDQIPFPNVLQLAKSDDGSIWLDGYSELCRWRPGSSEVFFPNRTGRPEGIALFKSIATGPDGSTWAAMDSPGPIMRLLHFIHGNWGREDFPKVAATNSEITALFVDRDNELWIGTSNRGMFRIQGSRAEHFGEAEGLTSNSVQSFCQDQEGNVWVVTSLGIDNFRDLPVSSFSMRDGLAADGAVSVLASRTGGVWILNNYETVQELKDGKFSTLLPQRDQPAHHVSTLFEDHAGRLWFGLDNGLRVYDNGTFRTVLHSDGTPLGLVFSITEDMHHDIWVRAGPNLDQIVNFSVQSERTSPKIATSYILAAAPDGGVVLGLVDGELLKFKSGETQSSSSNENDNRRQIRDLLTDPDGTVWGTTLNELFCWRGSRRETLTIRNGLPCDGIFALVEDDDNAIWLYSRCGLIRIARPELDHWWQHPDDLVHTQLLDEGEGVQAGLTSLKPQAARTPDGRLWFVNGHILQMININHLQENMTPPPVHVESVVADELEYSPHEGIRLPALTRDLEIDYTAISFVAPVKVRFRYRLEGHDADWQDPATRRQAFYTDLHPGKYRFHVIACNNDGVWNSTGATLDFSIAPAWYQTIWFWALCGILGVLVAWSLYRLRVRQIALAIHASFDERLKERTRLAREFHDTLLQTIQGSKMVADDALDESADPVRMRRALERLSIWMGQATQEGRAALNSLRDSTTKRNDLADAFQRATEGDLMPGTMSVTLSVVGAASEMHPIVRDEVYRIGYEAIRNASVHSKASHLDVELRYAQDLTLCVKDNGLGIDATVLDKGRDGHFGLQGMRERAARIGGKLSLVSSATSGTEIKLVVPGEIIFSPKQEGDGVQERVRRNRKYDRP